MFAHTESLPAAVRAIQRSVGERVTFTWITFRDAQFDDEESKKWPKEEVRHLQEITGPYLCRVIAQEYSPGLSRRSFGANQLLILLDGPFTHPNIQLEEFSTDALRSPEPVVSRHLIDQADRLGQEASASSSAPLICVSTPSGRVHAALEEASLAEQ